MKGEENCDGGLRNWLNRQKGRLQASTARPFSRHASHGHPPCTRFSIHDARQCLQITISSRCCSAPVCRLPATFSRKFDESLLHCICVSSSDRGFLCVQRVRIKTEYRQSSFPLLYANPRCLKSIVTTARTICVAYCQATPDRN
jgi:hypothetical protein